MALLETGMQPGQQVLKPTDTAALFRQSRTVGATSVAPQAIQPTPTPTQVPVPQQAATRPVASPAVAAPPPGTTSTTQVPKSSAAVPTPAAPGEQYQHQYKYESPQGDGLLDKNYYEDLGFSTTKEKAEELRGTLKDIDTEASALSGDIARYQTETDEARTALQEQVDNAWDNAATSTVTLGPTTWEVPRDQAVAIRNAIAGSFIPTELAPIMGLSKDQYWDVNRKRIEQLYGSSIPSELSLYHDPRARAAYMDAIELVKDKAYEDAAKLDSLEDFNFNFQYDGGDSEQRATYWALVDQISPQVSEMKVDYIQSFTDEAQKTFDILDERTLEAQQSTSDLGGQLTNVEMDKQAVVDKQAADRAGMAETFNALFRQRN